MQGARRHRLSRPAHRPTAPGADRRRANSPQQIYDLALLRALIGVGREMVENALDTSEEVDPKAQIEEAEAALLPRRRGGRRRAARSRASRGGDQHGAVQMAEKALNSAAATSRASPPASTSVNAKTGGLHHSDLIILAGRPGMGKTSLATNIAFNCGRPLSAGHARTGSSQRNRSAPGSPSSASKCRRDQLATRILAEQSRDQLAKRCAWARSASEDFRNSPAPPAHSQSCRSISTTRPA